MEQNTYKVLGLMSGTSLDGLDMAACTFVQGNTWEFEIEHAFTLPYTDEWKKRLAGSMFLPAPELMRLHADYGRFLGEQCRQFIQRTSFHPQLVASHGHTVFHQPQAGYTLQIGHAAYFNLPVPVVYDFRSADVALGGQGAPLVPVGDALLFNGYDACLNLGGFANISAQYNGKRIAFDIGAVNVVLNRLAQIQGNEFDKDGVMARSGTIHAPLLQQLDALEFYNLAWPKSLGAEWVNEKLWPLLENHAVSVADKAATFCWHMGSQIGKAIEQTGARNVLCTGGGAYHVFLLECIHKHTQAGIFVPPSQTVEFKEALIFAFLGLLRWRNEVNVYASVTGARVDHSSGIICMP